MNARDSIDREPDGRDRDGGRDTFEAMLDEVRAFHAKHRFADLGGEDMVYRVALMAEELGEISACVTKGKSKAELAEECADLLILLLGNAIAADFDLAQAFRDKMDAINRRGSRIVDGRVRVSKWSADSPTRHPRSPARHPRSPARHPRSPLSGGADEPEPQA